jgi:hypothetical protein
MVYEENYGIWCWRFARKKPAACGTYQQTEVVISSPTTSRNFTLQSLIRMIPAERSRTEIKYSGSCSRF